MVDQCILSWFYNTISKDVRAIVRAPKATEYTIWNAIHDQFRDHELHRAVYLEAEFRSLFQGDMDIKTYTGRLKQLVDDLHDVGQPIHETSQVLNMLRGLSPQVPARRPGDHRQEPAAYFPLRPLLLAPGGTVRQGAR